MPNRTPWYLVFLAGAGYAAIYYTVFRVLIRKLNLKTPGREDEEIAVATTLTREERPYQIIEAVGGFDNIEDVDACATRLRLALVDDKKVNEKRLKELGAAGLVKLGDGGVQVISLAAIANPARRNQNRNEQTAPDRNDSGLC